MAGQRAQDDDLKRNAPLQAIVLADSFQSKFQPISFSKPKVLLPLVNMPLIDYTIEFLATAGVKEIFVFCVAHAAQVEAYINTSRWKQASSGVSVTPISNTECMSPGQALRDIDDRQIIKSDFILVYGDLVSNVALEPVIRAHRARREADRGAIMTSVFRKVARGHRTRSVDDDTIVALDANNRIIHYERTAGGGPSAASKAAQARASASSKLDLALGLFDDRDAFVVRSDLLDCHIDICSPDVLMLCADNFDHEDMRDDFLHQVLTEEILDNKVYAHIVESEYAARVQCLPTYAAVSRDIIHRWTFPLVPDNNFCSNSTYRYQRNNVYKEQNVRISHSSLIGKDVVLGSGTVVGEGAVIVRSVIGRGCLIGAGVMITDAFIWDNVVVEDGAKITGAILCNEVCIAARADVSQSIVSFGCAIGAGFALPQGSRVTRIVVDAVQRDDEWGDEYMSLEESDETQGAGPKQGAGAAAASVTGASNDNDGKAWNPAHVGAGGIGMLFRKPGDMPEPTSSAAASAGADGARPLFLPVRNSLLDDDSTSSADEGDDDDSAREGIYEPERFLLETKETIDRAVEGNHEIGNVVLEMNALKFAYDRTFSDCINALIPAIVGLVSLTDSKTIVASARAVVARWSPLLEKYTHSSDDRLEMLLTLQQFCIDNEPFRKIFHVVMQLLYEHNLVLKETALSWERHVIEEADSPADVRAVELKLVKQAETFINWLRTQDDESGSYESDG